jgi:hypothetical protein
VAAARAASFFRASELPAAGRYGTSCGANNVRIQGDHHGQSQIGAVLGSEAAAGHAESSPVY